MFVRKLFPYLAWAYLKNQKVVYSNVKSSTYYFYIKTKTLAGFHVCISVSFKSRSYLHVNSFVILFHEIITFKFTTVLCQPHKIAKQTQAIRCLSVYFV